MFTYITYIMLSFTSYLSFVHVNLRKQKAKEPDKGNKKKKNLEISNHIFSSIMMSL